ncbi:glycosyltransferase [Dyella jejuensis]|uniref:Glycosyltransferase n=1 Tax=Dyella jejuensis TaxID=1432009 RepID=A0ABW8JD92_9GAMM
MNITHFVESLDRGGLERMVLELVKYQHRQGHHCQVVCLYSSGSLAHELDELGIAVKVCGKRQGIDLAALAQARRMVRIHATDVLHTHNAVAHYQAVLATCGLPVRQVINTRHGMGVNRRARRREWLYRRALARTDAVVTVCEAARSDAVKRGIVPSAKARVVPNGIRVEAFQPASAAMHDRLACRLNLPGQTRIVGTVGRLNWTKDQLSLLRAFKLVHEQHADTALVLVGDGELRASLEHSATDQGVAGSVHFLGDRNDVHELLQGLDMFVLSSLSEGYSMALLEASAVALPIVATSVGGNGEIVRDGITGRLVPAGNPAALAEAMLGLLRNPQQAMALGQVARAWVEQHGSLETMAMRYAQLYDGSKEWQKP